MSNVAEISTTNKPSTVTVEIKELRSLFMASNNSLGDAESDANPLSLAIDIIEHGAMELYTLHDALIGNPDRSQELADHAWRVSEQLMSGLAIVRALKNVGGAS